MCSFAWERGSKLFVTEAEQVNPNTRAVFWKQYLRQTATIYKDGTELMPKDYAFKVQSVKQGAKAGDEKRKTVGKVHVNLAQFCSEALDAQPQEVLLALKPAGKLKASIKATWLRNSRIDADAMTEVTANSLYADTHDGEEDEDEEYEEGDAAGWRGRGGGGAEGDEQDLSGFDPETGEPLHRGGHREHHHRERRRGGASTSAAAEGDGGDGGEGGEEYDEEGNPLPRRARRGRRGRRGRRTGSEAGIPEDGDGGEGGFGGEGGGGGAGHDPGGHHGGGGRRHRAGSRQSKGEKRPVLMVYGAQGTEGGGGGAVALQVEAGRQVHKTTWKDYVCCCLLRRGPMEDALEGDSLLHKGRVR